MNKEVLNNMIEKMKIAVEKIKSDKKTLAMVCIGAILVCIGLGGTIYGLVEYFSADKKYSDLENQFLVSDEDNLGKIEANEIEWYELARVDIAALKESYPEVVGWIMFENEKISYPIMQADNVKYLTTSYDGTQSKPGSIFMDELNSPYFTDAHTLIYGHNMQNLSMFGRLKFYKTQDDYYETHKYFQIYTEDEILRYQIFFGQDIPATSYIYLDRTLSAGTLASLMRRESMIDNDIPIEDDDKIVTLSTCTAADDERFVVSAVLVDRYSLADDEKIESTEATEEIQETER